MRIRMKALLFFFQSLLIYASTRRGGVAEWSCSGLQLRGRRFDSDLGLHRPKRSPGPSGADVRLRLPETRVTNRSDNTPGLLPRRIAARGTWRRSGAEVRIRHEVGGLQQTALARWSKIHRVQHISQWTRVEPRPRAVRLELTHMSTYAYLRWIVIDKQRQHLSHL